MAMLPPSVATVTAARMEGGADSATLAFDVSAPVSAHPSAHVSAHVSADMSATLSPAAFVLVDPDRAIIDLPQVDFAMDAAAGRPAAGPRAKGRAALVSSFRFGLLAPGRSRIVIDLGAPAKIVSASVRTIEGRSRLVVELARTDRAAFRAAARAAVSADRFAAPAPAVASQPAAADAVTIVLDPGHGGPDTGAIVNGVVEKDIALAFASRLAAKLGATGTFKVVMTRSSDVFIPLSERVRIAREAGAALMVSVHADTLPETGDVGGATVYTVSDKASDAYAAKVAAKENAADTTVGVDGQADTADVNDILFDLTRQETRAYSHVFARTLVNYWKVAGRLNKNPQRAAGFVVLKAPDVPSVLLELGYLSNATGRRLAHLGGMARAGDRAHGRGHRRLLRRPAGARQGAGRRPHAFEGHVFEGRAFEGGAFEAGQRRARALTADDAADLVARWPQAGDPGLPRSINPRARAQAQLGTQKRPRTPPRREARGHRRTRCAGSPARQDFARKARDACVSSLVSSA